jgi:hypothetical protein
VAFYVFIKIAFVGKKASELIKMHGKTKIKITEITILRHTVLYL